MVGEKRELAFSRTVERNGFSMLSIMSGAFETAYIYLLQVRLILSYS